MALHELTTNAAKYGALSNDKGRVQIEWKVGNGADGRIAEISWTESGGPPVAAPERKGFGSRLIERHLANELGGEVSLEYRKEGVVCWITTPLAARDAVLSASGQR
jgi:two-component sensor histidine kinase